MKSNNLRIDSLKWGFVLWLIGYILSFVLFFAVPPFMIGWIIAPVGTVITLLVLFKKIKSNDWRYYLILAVVWTLLAAIQGYSSGRLESLESNKR